MSTNRIGPGLNQAKVKQQQQHMDYFNKMAFELGYDEHAATDVNACTNTLLNNYNVCAVYTNFFPLLVIGYYSYSICLCIKLQDGDVENSSTNNGKTTWPVVSTKNEPLGDKGKVCLA